MSLLLAIGLIFVAVILLALCVDAAILGLYRDMVVMAAYFSVDVAVCVLLFYEFLR